MSRVSFTKIIFSAIFLCSSLLADQSIIYSLEDIEKLAEQNNVTLRSLKLESELSELSKRSRFRDFFPTLNLSYRRNRTIAERDFDTGSN